MLSALFFLLILLPRLLRPAPLLLAVAFLARYQLGPVGGLAEEVLLERETTWVRCLLLRAGEWTYWDVGRLGGALADGVAGVEGGGEEVRHGEWCGG